MWSDLVALAGCGLLVAAAATVSLTAGLLVGGLVLLAVYGAVEAAG